MVFRIRQYLCKFQVEHPSEPTELTSSRYDAVIYARALANRSPGTHNLHLVEEADHNFTGVGVYAFVTCIYRMYL